GTPFVAVHKSPSRAFPKFESHGTVRMPAFCGHKSQDCNGQESWNRSSSGTSRRISARLEFSVAIGGAADMDGRAAQTETGANDPQRKSRDRACRDAQQLCLMW